jgi:hypothetical protein
MVTMRADYDQIGAPIFRLVENYALWRTGENSGVE